MKACILLVLLSAVGLAPIARADTQIDADTQYLMTVNSHFEVRIEKIVNETEDTLETNSRAVFHRHPTRPNDWLDGQNRLGIRSVLHPHVGKVAISGSWPFRGKYTIVAMLANGVALVAPRVLLLERARELPLEYLYPIQSYRVNCMSALTTRSQ